MFCKYCGKTLKDGSKFCKYCGKKLEKKEKADATQQPSTTTIQPSMQQEQPMPTVKLKKKLGTGAIIGIAASGLAVVAVLVVLVLTLGGGIPSKDTASIEPEQTVQEVQSNLTNEEEQENTRVTVEDFLYEWEYFGTKESMESDIVTDDDNEVFYRFMSDGSIEVMSIREDGTVTGPRIAQSRFEGKDDYIFIPEHFNPEVGEFIFQIDPETGYLLLDVCKDGQMQGLIDVFKKVPTGTMHERAEEHGQSNDSNGVNVAKSEFYG